MSTPTAHIKFELDTTLNDILEKCLNYSSKNPGVNNIEISQIVNDATILKTEISEMIKKSEAQKNEENMQQSLLKIQDKLKQKSNFLRGRIDGLSRIV